MKLQELKQLIREEIENTLGNSSSRSKTNKNITKMRDIIRMNQLAGIITEGQAKKMMGILKEGKPKKGFKPYQPTEDDNERFDGNVLAAFSTPMEGWDEDNIDTVVVVEEDGEFYVDGYIAFGDFDDVENTGPFRTEEEALNRAQEIMKKITSGRY